MDKMTNKECPLIDCENWDSLDCGSCNHLRYKDYPGTMNCYRESRITPEQYSERTGEIYPDAGIVWYNWQDSYGKWSGWLISQYEDTKGFRQGCIGQAYRIICILPPLPPNTEGEKE